MKFLKFVIIILLINFFSSCQNSETTSNCRNLTIYTNSFENYHDLLNLQAMDSSMLCNEASPAGGEKVLKICSCCNYPLCIINLPVILKSGEYQIKFWARQYNGQNFSSIKISTNENQTYYTFIIRDTLWKKYSSIPIYLEANTELRIDYWVSGSNNACILFDNLEFIKLN